MSTVAEEVYAGRRCAVCETRFTVAELADVSSPLLYLRETAEMVHTSCWRDPDGATGGAR